MSSNLKVGVFLSDLLEKNAECRVSCSSIVFTVRLDQRDDTHTSCVNTNWELGSC